jgi:hypothetical protein
MVGTPWFLTSFEDFLFYMSVLLIAPKQKQDEERHCVTAHHTIKMRITQLDIVVTINITP